MAWPTEMDVLLFGCTMKDVQLGGNRIIKRLLGCIRTWGNMDLSVTINDRPVNFGMNLEARISVAVATIRETPGFFERIRQPTLRWCLASINTNGGNSKNLL
ncbi:hypothetical protein TNCV_2398991 [Trichonephila clavipes]|uniref:Uncharacterized protein n=1 Tax=Trichonephila clavipes TaxID=2585209 RepID=A0A8X6SWH4_TRICX|nr:hypothetical protein TNCV_2398991 [Trichonephila clavipes]